MHFVGHFLHLVLYGLYYINKKEYNIKIAKENNKK